MVELLKQYMLTLRQNKEILLRNLLGMLSLPNISQQRVKDASGP